MAITNIPFFPDSPDCGKVYRSPMPNTRDLERYSSEFKITTIVQLCFDREFSTYGKENVLKLREAKQFKVIKFPIEDFKIPKSKADTREMVDRIIGLVRDGENVVIHCVGGNGRTGLMLACLARKILNLDGPEAVRWVRKFVSTAVERPLQEKFVATYLEDDEEVRDSFEETYRTSSFRHPRPMPLQRSAQITSREFTQPTKENDFPSTDDDEWDVYPKSSPGKELDHVVTSTPKPSSSTGSSSSLALIVVDTPHSAEKAKAPVQAAMTSVVDASPLPREEEKTSTLSEPVLVDSRRSPRKKKKRPEQSQVDSSEKDKPVRPKKKETVEPSYAKTEKAAEEGPELLEVIVEVSRDNVTPRDDERDKSRCFDCCTIQ
jgi:protein-tyrosine phosphatase